TYPDIMVVQTPLVFEEGRNDTITNPVMIAEVLSKSTKGYDRDEKFAAYRTISNFQEYILIDQYMIHVEQYVKTDNKKWMFLEYEDINDTLNLTSVSCQISLADIYEKIDFSSAES
ncbi:MAG: Uma2 family endonuclease, partial [Dolichospermum sp.]